MQTILRLAGVIALTLAPLLAFSPAQAQSDTRTTAPRPYYTPSAMPSGGLFFGLRYGTNYYGGDLDAANYQAENDAGIGLELSYQLGRRLALAFDYQRGGYPKIDETAALTSARLLGRFTLSNGYADPYLIAGAHRTSTESQSVFGPTGGLGLAVRLTSWLQLYNEASFNFILDDTAIDGAAGGSSFDLTGSVAVGFRIRGFGGRTPAPAVVPALPVRSAEATPASSEPARASDDPMAAASEDTASNTAESTAEPARVVPAEDSATSEPDVPSVPAYAEPKLTEGYTWVVASLTSQPKADSLLVSYRGQGYPGQLIESVVNGKPHYRVTIGRYVTRPEAVTVKDALPSHAWLLRAPFASDEPMVVETRQPETQELETQPLETKEPAAPDASTPAEEIAQEDASPAETPVEKTALPAPDSKTAADAAALAPKDAFYTLVVGSYNSRRHAERALYDYLKEGHAGQVVSAYTDGEARFRVTLGRYDSKSAAEQAQLDLPVTPWIMRTNPKAVAPKPAAPTTAENAERYFTWVLGAYARRSDAQRLLTGYQEDGYEGQIVVTQSRGRLLHRVTLGRYSTREAARSRRSIARLPALPAGAWVLEVE